MPSSMSINSYVLSKFPHQEHPEGSSKSLATKSQLLSIFYLNFVLTLLMALFEIGSYLFLPLPISRILTFICIVGSALSLILLREGYHDLAGGVTLVYVHLVNSITTHGFHAPMAGIFGTICYINLSYYLTRSNKIIMINALASLVELSLHVLKVLQIFRNTLDEDQSIQIWSGSIALFVAFGYLSGLSFFQKANLSSLWYMVQEHCERSHHFKKEVFDANKSQKALISSFSEEAKNTMKSLNFGIDSLFKILKDPNSTNVLQNLKLSGQLLLNLINNSLDAARIEANTLELNYEDTDFEEDVVKKALKTHSEGLKEKNIFVQTFIDKEMPAKLSVDSSRMLQIMLNLLSNAARSTSKNGKTFLRISWHEQNEYSCTIQDLLKVQYSNEISDTSIENNLEESFPRMCSSQEFSHEENTIRQRNLSALQRSTTSHAKMEAKSDSWSMSKVSFRQSANQQSNRESSFTSNTQGAGYLKIQVSDTSNGIPAEKLGDVFKITNGVEMWICKQLALKMSGDIIVESHIRRGTDFVLCIPTFYPKEDSTVKKEETNKIKMNVLVVDDFESNRILHKLMLEKNGAKVQVAHNGKEAIEMFTSHKEKRFDFILMDVFMPDVDGFAAAKKIREWEQANKMKETDIYFVTGGYFAGEELSNIFEKIGGKDKDSLRMVSKPMEMHIVESILCEQKSKL